MITIVAVIKVHADRADDAAGVFADICAAVAEEPRTLAYAVARSQTDPAEFTVFEQYPDQAALDEHKAGRAYTEVQIPLRALLDGVPRVVVGDLVATAR